MRRRLVPALLVTIVLTVATTAACGSGTGDEGSDDRPTVVVTTTVLGDVVQRLVGDRAEVQVLMPRGADPHDVQLSARQAADLRRADAVVANGGGFEAGYHDALEAAEADGVPTHHALDDVATLALGEGDGAHVDEEGEEDGHGPVDPHFFTDPDRMADAAAGIAAFLADAVPVLDAPAARAAAAAQVEALRGLADEVEALLAPLPPERRVLVTNHEVFGYFADRYRFEVVGAIIPGGGTGAEPSAGELDALARTIEAEGVPAVFADVSSPRGLAQALADEVGQVEVVGLLTESLGPAGSGGATYEEMVRTNARRIADALG